MIIAFIELYVFMLALVTYDPFSGSQFLDNYTSYTKIPLPWPYFHHIFGCGLTSYYKTTQINSVDHCILMHIISSIIGLLKRFMMTSVALCCDRFTVVTRGNQGASHCRNSLSSFLVVMLFPNLHSMAVWIQQRQLLTLFETISKVGTCRLVPYAIQCSVVRHVFVFL